MIFIFYWGSEVGESKWFKSLYEIVNSKNIIFIEAVWLSIKNMSKIYHSNVDKWRFFIFRPIVAVTATLKTILIRNAFLYGLAYLGANFIDGHPIV